MKILPEKRLQSELIAPREKTAPDFVLYAQGPCCRCGGYLPHTTTSDGDWSEPAAEEPTPAESPKKVTATQGTQTDEPSSSEGTSSQREVYSREGAWNVFAGHSGDGGQTGILVAVDRVLREGEEGIIDPGFWLSCGELLEEPQDG